MSISLRELHNTLLGRSGYSGAYLSYASLKQLAAQAINMYAIRTTTLPADAGADYNAGYTSCSVHTVSNPTKDSLKEYDDTYVTHMASGYAARQTIATCYCESRTAVGCDCEGRGACGCLGAHADACTCNVESCACEFEDPPSFFCDCELRTASCECQGVTCSCDDRTTEDACVCDNRCRCNTVDLYTCPSNT